ncbi:hypothetical protein [Pseudoduganella namucuonensis]|nr:hypothetical protein [Pseudoduganella namucuonensis]
MDRKQLLEHYEKQYIHEIESREKLNARVQNPLTIIVAFVGALSFLLQNYGHPGFNLISISFISLFTLSVIAVMVALYFFIKAWHGNHYRFMPSASTNETHRIALQEYYTTHGDGATQAIDKFDDYLMEHYIKYASFNSQCNDKRSLNIHHANGFIIIATGFAFFSFLVFYFGDLDKAKQSKAVEVSIVTPIILKGALMPNDRVTPPPPPPPPPAREIKEGVRPSAPPPKPNGK